MIGPNFITDMMGLLSWVLAVIAIHWVLKEPFKARRKQIREYLSGRWDRWRSRSGLKKTYFVLASIVVSIFFYSFWFIFPEFLDKIDDKNTSFYNLSLAVFAILSGFGAVFGFYTSIIKTETAEQGQITDRLNKAIENLGKITVEGDPVIEVRIGALLALERIAQDSIRDHIQIMEIICAYIRHNSPLPDRKNAKNNSSDVIEINAKRRKNDGENIDEDIQTALTIIGRRGKWPEGNKRLKKESDHEYRIYLFKCYLYGAKFSGANLENASLIGSDMRDTWFDDTNLIDATLANTNLTGAWFEETVLKDTELGNAITDGILSHYGDFSKCSNLIQKQLNVMFLGKDVEIPTNRTHPQKGTDYYQTYDTFNDFLSAYYEWIDAQL